MKIRLACAEIDADYIRHARTETLKELNQEVTPAGTEPVPIASYLFAMDERTDRPMGMTETAILRDVYSDYNESPNAQICDLNRYCPLEQMSSIRTVYVDAQFRTSLVFFSLTMAAARLCYDQGTRFVTATTSGDNDYLKTLYAKCGGDFAGRKDVNNIDMALFVFDLEKSINHRSFSRLAQNFAFLQDRRYAAAGMTSLG